MSLLQAHGKLLISGEYMVMYGSQALAVPLKKGQRLQKIRSEDRTLFSWNAYRDDDPWFRACFNPSTLGVVTTTDQKKARYLQNMLKACIELDPSFQGELFDWDVETILDFSPEWGLGSSSSLTALVAEWADINPLDLHFMISEGSGYDVACAITDSAIIYSLLDDGPHYQPVHFNPPFADRLYFVWLGSKQETADHLAEMAGKLNPDLEMIETFSTLTRGMIEAGELYDFRILMEEHESKVSELIRRDRVSETRFPGLLGSVKSLGAWGGDFVMIASEQDTEALYNYLDNLGFTHRFRYKDLVYEG
jgi:mevalonate kinase